MSIRSTSLWAYLLLATLLLIATQVDAGSTSEAGASQPKELGQIEWLRDFSSAEDQGRTEGKPLFLLFQEVPGCQTCVDFGEQVLSHPLLIEAIEDEFIPVAIHNNKPGADRRVLERFREPAWNNPVVRFVDANGNDLIPRRAGLWQPAEIAERMSASLAAAGRPIPSYLSALGKELGPQKIERATLSMGCYWRGEACLGALPGLLSTRTGDLGGREVVEIRYDAARVDYSQILSHARDNQCADGVFAHNEDQLRLARPIYGDAARVAAGLAQPASERNQKYHLKRNQALDALDLTPAQATKLNHAAWKKQDPTPLLSPRQRAQLGSPEGGEHTKAPPAPSVRDGAFVGIAD